MDKKFLPIISNTSLGVKLRNLRLKNHLTIKELAKNLEISYITLMHLEQNKIKTPYYYCRLICNNFNVNYISYLELYTLNENTMQDKLIKIRAYLGARTWKEVGEYLGYSESFITDLMTRYKGNEKHFKIVNDAMEKLK